MPQNSKWEGTDRFSKAPKIQSLFSIVLNWSEKFECRTKQFSGTTLFSYGDIHYLLSYLLTMEPHNKRALIWLLLFHPERRYVYHVYGILGQDV